MPAAVRVTACTGVDKRNPARGDLATSASTYRALPPRTTRHAGRPRICIMPWFEKNSMMKRTGNLKKSPPGEDHNAEPIGTRKYRKNSSEYPRAWTNEATVVSSSSVAKAAAPARRPPG